MANSSYCIGLLKTISTATVTHTRISSDVMLLTGNTHSMIRVVVDAAKQRFPEISSRLAMPADRIQKYAAVHPCPRTACLLGNLARFSENPHDDSLLGEIYTAAASLPAPAHESSLQIKNLCDAILIDCIENELVAYPYQFNAIHQTAFWAGVNAAVLNESRLAQQNQKIASLIDDVHGPTMKSDLLDTWCRGYFLRKGPFVLSDVFRNIADPVFIDVYELAAKTPMN